MMEPVMIEDLILKNRSTRRFAENCDIKTKTLEHLVNLARLSASGANLQPLKYVISNNRQKNNHIFETLKWAGYLQNWPGPKPQRRPAGYIIICCDTTIVKNADNCKHDQGIAAAYITLGAAEKQLASCIIGNINRKKLQEILSLSDRYEIALVIALGKSGENISIEEVDDNESVKYYRDDNNIHHVPKRRLNNIIIAEYS